MLVRKVGYSLVSNSDFICLIGGKIKTEDQDLIVTNLCEIYSVEHDQWSMLPSLNVKRAHACSCLFNQRYVYIFGGETTDYPGFAINEHIERLDLANKTAQWQELDLGTVQGSCWFSPKSQAIQVNEFQIYIFGGVGND